MPQRENDRIKVHGKNVSRDMLQGWRRLMLPPLILIEPVIPPTSGQHEYKFKMKNFSSGALLPFSSHSAKMRRWEVGKCRAC
jgi:hypothetical protein